MLSTVKAALSRVHSVVKKKGSHVLHSSEIDRADRILLLRNHWLEVIIRGWYLLIRPDSPPGDSTTWYANFWDFLHIYLKYHYGSSYCLSAESSVDIHTGASVIPKQVIVIAPKGKGSPLSLPYDTSLLVYADSQRLPKEREQIRGLQVMPMALALCKISPTYFRNSPNDAEIALRSLSQPSDLLSVIINHNFVAAAGRLIGAYRFLGEARVADELKRSLDGVGVIVHEVNPFQDFTSTLVGAMSQPPAVIRLHTMWAQFRSKVVSIFPPPPGLPKKKKSYLEQVNDRYALDAYNSLSIEGYRVTEELIERVQKANWSPDKEAKDQQQYDALAARGYYDAFQVVKKSVGKVLGGANSGQVVSDDLADWYQKLFNPSVQAGILSASDLFGYRRQQVYIRHSRYTPPAKEYVADLMDALIELLKHEEHPGVRAVLGHFFFVYIHPYMDGNGRIGRFLMNVMLASGGYPWTIIKVTQRDKYLQALEAASAGGDITPFIRFIRSELKHP